MISQRPLVIGHRGAPGHRPEHTRSSYELALALGADAVEPDVVATRDGVLVVRHENEISGTTDVAEHPEFADRRTTKVVDGETHTGWFTEDFTWSELTTLRCRERLPALRPQSAVFDDREPILRLSDVLDLVRDAGAASGGKPGVVLEVKHATYFAELGVDLASLIGAEVRRCGWDGGAQPLVVESFELSVLERLRADGIRGTYVYLLESEGSAADLVAERGADAPTYRAQLEPDALSTLRGRADGISVDKRILLDAERSRVVADAHARGLEVFTWTCRPENAFLDPRFQGPGAPGEHGDWRAEWAVIRDLGVDGVFVDHAELGVAFFGAGAD